MSSPGKVAVDCARRGIVVASVSLIFLAMLAGVAVADPIRNDGTTETVLGDAGKAEIGFFTEYDTKSPVFNTTYGVAVKVFDTAKDDGCAYVNYSLVQENSGDNEGKRVEACGTGKDSGEPKEFRDHPWFQHIAGVEGWKFQVCKKKRFGGDSCGLWNYFKPDGTRAEKFR